MSPHSLLSFSSAVLCGALATFAMVKERRSLVYGIFAFGMVALALERTFIGLGSQAELFSEALRWQRLSLVAAAFVPGSWLLFSLCFARANRDAFLATWKWVIFATFAFPLCLATIFGNALLVEISDLDESALPLFRLGWSGYAFYHFFLLGTILILMNLEKTLRASSGTMRWQIKFVILGLGSLFAVRLYTSSQTLLFSAVDMDLDAVNSAALIVASLLIVVSLVRAQLLHGEVYLSQTFVYNSVTVLAVGLYLLAVGVMAKAVSYLGGSQALPVAAFFVFVALLGLAITLLSDQLRREIQRFLYRHFRLPRYDYRKEWMTFTQRTTSLVDIHHLCAAIASSVGETFGVSSVTIWLLDDAQERFVLGGSTVFSEGQARVIKSAEKGALELVRAMRDQKIPVDFDGPATDWAAALKEANRDYFLAAEIRYGVTLAAGHRMMGVMTLGDRVTKEPLSVEDYDLLTTIAEQAAASLLNLKLSEDLLRAKEMEDFQTFSAFLIHDLKNLASTLSLTMQNLSIHFDKPEFRADLVQTMAKSLNRLNAMCGRLSLLGKRQDMRMTESDLNELVAATAGDLDGSLKAPLIQNLQPTRRLLIDPEQMQKVLINLILNANDAVGDRGEIQVMTEEQNGWVTLCVKDNGCGMSKEFINRSLFQPFQTGKSHGLGIGLFQCKKIVDAHRGRIEVESEEGKGSSFRIMLPAGRRT